MHAKQKASTARARADQALKALAPAPGDVVVGRGLPTKALRPLELHALARVGKAADKVRDALKPGLSQPVDLTLRIWGTIDVGNEQTATIRKKPDLREVLAVVLGSLKPKDRTAAVELAIERLKHPRPEIQLSPDWLAFVEGVEAELTQEIEQTKRGNVTGTLETEVLCRDLA